MQIVAFLASVLLVAQSEDDGKYRPEVTTSVPVLRTIPTTRLPIVPPVVPAAYPGWNSRRYWPNDRYDPRYENRDTRLYDTRYNPNGN